VPAPDLAEAAVRAVAAARDRLAVARTALFWAAEGAPAALTCIATAGEGDPAAWLGHALPTGVGMAARAVAAGRPVATPDLLAEPGVPLTPWLRERLEREGLRAVAAAPVRVGGAIRGALGMLAAAGRVFDEAALARLAAEAAAVGRQLERTLGGGR